ncbi:MAG TPA: hypothetical protein VHB53_13055 [Solirubrobacterales bacterium]|nr:hypothetical protein [Solirubrobacterales bacterium]
MRHDPAPPPIPRLLDEGAEPADEMQREWEAEMSHSRPRLRHTPEGAAGAADEEVTR